MSNSETLEKAYHLAEAYLATGQYEAASRLIATLLNHEAAPNYQSIVRPQLQQMNFNRQQQRRNQLVYRQLQELQGRPAFNPRGSANIIPTGHIAVFGNLSRFYPSTRRRRR